MSATKAAAALRWVAFKCRWCGATICEVPQGSAARGRCPKRDCRLWTETASPRGG